MNINNIKTNYLSILIFYAKKRDKILKIKLRDSIADIQNRTGSV